MSIASPQCRHILRFMVLYTSTTERRRALVHLYSACSGGGGGGGGRGGRGGGEWCIN